MHFLKRHGAGVLLIGLLAVVACAKSSSQGVTSPQAPNGCVEKGAACQQDADCCTFTCDNGTCVRPPGG
jgi:hypothetical protein